MGFKGVEEQDRHKGIEGFLLILQGDFDKSQDVVNVV
jgi:hypothetical protein